MFENGRTDPKTGAKSPAERRWILENQSRHFCECGCGKAITINRTHRYGRGIPRLIRGHHILKWIRENQGKHFCQCGCNRVIRITRATWNKGLPRFIKGHSTRHGCVNKWIAQNQGQHICSCGCGQPITIIPDHKYDGIPAIRQGHRHGLPIDLWVKKETGKHFCGCGCERSIKIIPDHRKRGISRFIHGHNSVGPSNASWKGGTSKTYASRRGRLQPSDWPQQVKDRDGHRCQWPGCRNTKQLHAHHLIPFSKDPSIVGELWNGITLCESCHYKVKGHEIDYAEFFLNLLQRGA